MNNISPSRIKAARAIAIATDFLQIAVFPVFAPGFFSAIDDVLDGVVCVTLTWLVGWHFAFLPSFIVKVLPIMDLAPTWTIAIFLATRQKSVSAEPPVTEVYAERILPPQLPEAQREDNR